MRRFWFHQRPQTPKRIVPLAGDPVQVAARLLQALLVHTPDGFASTATAPHEARRLHHSQVFGDRLAGDPGTQGELGDRERAVVTEAGDEAQARLIPQRREDVSRIWIGAWLAYSRRLPAREHGPGIPR